MWVTGLIRLCNLPVACHSGHRLQERCSCQLRPGRSLIRQCSDEAGSGSPGNVIWLCKLHYHLASSSPRLQASSGCWVPCLNKVLMSGVSWQTFSWPCCFPLLLWEAKAHMPDLFFPVWYLSDFVLFWFFFVLPPSLLDGEIITVCRRHRVKVNDRATDRPFFFKLFLLISGMFFNNNEKKQTVKAAPPLPPPGHGASPSPVSLQSHMFQAVKVAADVIGTGSFPLFKSKRSFLLFFY